MERIAIIDLGTNTFKILLADVDADGKYQVLLRNKIPVKLSDGGVADNIITTDAFQRGINVLNMFKYNLIDYFDVQRVFAFATSAIRSTANGHWFVDYVKKHIGINIEVITGTREAELIYKGVRSAVKFEKAPYLVCDIGGGSTEFIIGNNKEILWMQSFRLGASRLVEKLTRSETISLSEIEAMQLYFDKKLEPLFKALKQYPVKALVGSSGAFSTLARMSRDMREGKPSKLPTVDEIPHESLFDVCDTILKTKHHERQSLPGMKLMRVKMMVPAAVFIRFLVKKINFERILFSDYALKEGVFAQVIDDIIAEQ